MGPSIKRASVNCKEELFALNQTHLLFLKSNTSDTKKSTLIGLGDTTSHFASSPFTRAQNVLIGDAVGHTIWQQDYDKQCTEATVEGKAAQEGMSGMNYTATTIVGEYGDVWYYNLKTATSAENINNTATSSKIYKVEIDPPTGESRNPTTVVDLYQVLSNAGVKATENGMDHYGMCMGVEGNLFISLNAIPSVLRWNTKAPGDAIYIRLTTVFASSNLEFCGDDGMTLYFVGRCQNLTQACVDAYKHDKAGHAITNL
ncbi:hypothetical protein B9Z19DRAFT_1162684 [Tuber borchii]|uniref:Uncharacterized protein n=1 Tax=Tuber borchii TaxID=42251 RepID=A0A2T6ZDK8_TUBBO|nr:hypothetical protein B9Z19DRAFT_1162684 [Tuber borchii]